MVHAISLSAKLQQIWHQPVVREQLTERLAMRLLPPQHSAEVTAPTLAISRQGRSSVGVFQFWVGPLPDLARMRVDGGVSCGDFSGRQGSTNDKEPIQVEKELFVTAHPVGPAIAISTKRRNRGRHAETTASTRRPPRQEGCTSSFRNTWDAASAWLPTTGFPGGALRRQTPSAARNTQDVRTANCRREAPDSSDRYACGGCHERPAPDRSRTRAISPRPPRRRGESGEPHA
mmetsp:Transcript_28703/g.78964  ORF Transcript_28703/g.78964 Transcript_28703/m.78964 type:complete len:232 (-) Transcript_28703:2-697(-)